MPTYEYRCAKCGNHFEIYQSFTEEPLKKHPSCGGKVTKVLSAAGIVLKGSGFYKTDSSDSARSRSKKRSEPATTAASSDGGGSGTSSGSSGSEGSGTTAKSEPSKASSPAGSSTGEKKSA
jgi:putative FmdB family regulatory protein